jgi:eukaryotic-like serine/threonine-protein kinase
VSTPTIAPGLTLGKYRVIGPLGSGGMGGVWDVEDLSGNRYALKSPATGLGHDPGMLKRFAREANALRMIEHPNLVAAVDVFVEGGFLFLVMERVAGRTLSKALAGGPMQPRRALVLTRQLLEGLGHAHTQGLVHRDMKPDNAMLVDMGGWERAKIVDWGLVKLIGDAEAAMGGDKLTRTGIVSGTPRYMAPEQALGRVVDGRADLYAVGLMLFEMLVGRVPFEHDDPVALMRMQVKTPAPRLDAVVGAQPWCTPELMSLVQIALAKEAAQRFANAQHMIAALDAAFGTLDHVR